MYFRPRFSTEIFDPDLCHVQLNESVNLTCRSKNFKIFFWNHEKSNVSKFFHQKIKWKIDRSPPRSAQHVFKHKIIFKYIYIYINHTIRTSFLSIYLFILNNVQIYYNLYLNLSTIYIKYKFINISLNRTIQTSFLSIYLFI